MDLLIDNLVMSQQLLNQDYTIRELKDTVVSLRKQLESVMKKHALGLESITSEYQYQVHQLQQNVRVLRDSLDQMNHDFQHSNDELMQQEALRRSGLESIIKGLRRRLDEEIANQQQQTAKHQLEMDRLKGSFKTTIQKLRDQLDTNL
tara:strand:+ start:308 stop:751 length:444 start_codon:yes stop_codon:yes gene_type:complete